MQTTALISAELPQVRASPCSGGESNVAVAQIQWYHFGEGAPPILVYFSRDWDVLWGYGILTHSHV